MLTFIQFASEMDRLVPKRLNFIANALEFCCFWTDPSVILPSMSLKLFTALKSRGLWTDLCGHRRCFSTNIFLILVGVSAAEKTHWSFVFQLTKDTTRAHEGACLGYFEHNLLHNNIACFYQIRSAWSLDWGSVSNSSAIYNFAPTVMQFCDMLEQGWF